MRAAWNILEGVVGGAMGDYASLSSTYSKRLLWSKYERTLLRRCHLPLCCLTIRWRLGQIGLSSGTSKLSRICIECRSTSVSNVIRPSPPVSAHPIRHAVLEPRQDRCPCSNPYQRGPTPCYKRFHRSECPAGWKPCRPNIGDCTVTQA